MVLKEEGIDAISCPQLAPNTYLCAVGRRTFSINPFGDVQPCLQYVQKAGNLRQDTFQEIWQDSSLLKEIRNMWLDDLHNCVNCRDLKYCQPCIGLAYLEGDPLGPASSHCLLAKSRRQIAQSDI